MKLGQQLPPPSKSDKRILLGSIIVFLTACVIAVLVLINRNSPQALDIIGPLVTLTPGVAGASTLIDQMTAMPSAQPLTGALADEIRAVGQMVSSCNDYSQARRDQMNQHIAWLLQPNTLPKEMIIALGTNINGRLIFGMATFTLAEWGQHAKATDSCLLTIGKKLNDMLETNGETRFSDFDGANG